MIFLLFLSLLFAEDYCKDSQRGIDKNYEALSQSIQKKIKSSSHLAPIAKEADTILSKLIQAKSPILMNWLEKRNLLSQKEEIIAGEWRHYYLENFILSKYPTKNAQINESVEHLFSEINQLSFNDDYKKKVQKTFEEAQKVSIQKIESMNISKTVKDEITARLRKVKLYWFSQLKGSKFERIPLEFVKWGVAYDPVVNEINIGTQIRKYANDTILFSVFAHELGHSFDSCRWSAFFTTPNPFSGIYTCLRSKESAGAQKRNDSQMSAMIKKKWLTPEMAESLKLNPTCNRSFYPPVGTQKDQLPETFADWFAAEVVSISPYLNQDMRADLCQNQNITDGSSYLSHQDRLRRIYLAHPLIQEKLKLKSKAKYCPSL